ncbi:CCA tRNA nucleotidyltransferase [Virgibacillus dakarensis]|nr:MULTISPECIES: CCA tRNA nucleotidyltransferase [Bacillaceae]MBT2214245.1 CCA tRNA nucleotidyltransferase [Virgibacillus dakarensis]MTW85930.1 CCA tRNA nucleotidyltransferase [Virgibacillus dakarensis]
MEKNPFELAKPILKKLVDHGYQAFFVGGCVRDMLLDRPIGDVDIATSAQPHEVQELFEKVIPVGIKHGTVIVRHQHESYEVTTFRLDGEYSDSRHPDDVEFIQTIDQDLKRRDFTINALAMDLHGHVIDRFAGKKDLERRLIRTVGNGNERFSEDPLRIIRALRFASQLGFTIEQETLSNMIRQRPQINGLAVERITTEVTKLFSGAFVNKGLDYLKSTEIYKQLPVMIEYPYMIKNLPNPIKPLQSFGEVIALFHFTEPDVKVDRWAKSWKCSNKIKQEAEQLANALFHYQQFGLDRWLVYRLNTSIFPGFIRLGENLFARFLVTLDDLQQMTEDLAIHSIRELDIDGNDLIQLFPELKKGPWIKNYLSRLEKAVVNGKLKNNKTELKEWIKWNPPETN